MHRMPHLVEAVLFRLPEIARFIERIVFEEETDLVTRFLEVTIVELRLFHRRKHVPDFGRIKRIDELQRMFAQAFAPFRRNETLKNQDPCPLIVGQHRFAELPPWWSSICR
jgi:hypothetical protein